MDSSSIKHFWRHCQGLGPWSNHPIFQEDDFPLGQTIPLAIHGDGAQFYREDEMFVFSVSSLFAPTGVIQDILLYKFPFLIIPERFMRSEKVSQQKHEKLLNMNVSPHIQSNYFSERCLLFPPLSSCAQVSKEVNRIAADLASWSIQCAMKGVGPDRGFRGEQLTGHRVDLIGKPLANGWRFSSYNCKLSYLLVCFQMFPI
jgi:hypothetical protein